jgi:vacuolar-type H+-ATPase subunit F/Vma7
MTTRPAGGGDLGVAALGDEVGLAGLRLVGVHVRVATTSAEVRQAWAALQEAGLVILTPSAADVLGAERVTHGGPLTVVMPS